MSGRGLRSNGVRAFAALLERGRGTLPSWVWLIALVLDVGVTAISARVGFAPLPRALIGLATTLGFVARLAHCTQRQRLGLLLFAAPLRLAVAEALSANVWVAAAVSIVATVIMLACGIAALRAKSNDGAFRAALLLAIVAYALALRVVFATSTDLIPEEAYYWCYARHLALGYLDHPPLIAWMIAATTALFGHREIAVRAGALACGLALACVVALTTRKLHGRRASWIAFALAGVLPYTFAIGLVATPEAPLAVAWAAALYFLRRALLDGRASGWIGAGVCIGLGMLAKYSIALLVPAALVFVVVDRPSRRWLAHPAPYVGLVLIAALFTPVIVWNAQHEWMSFLFQSENRMSEALEFHLPELILGALLMMTPVGLAAVWVALRPRESTNSRERTFTAVTLLVPLGVFTLNSLVHSTRIHWTGPIWIAAVPLLASLIASHATPSRSWWLRPRTWIVTSFTLLGLFAWSLLCVQLDMPFVPWQWRQSIPISWSALAAKVETTARELELGSDRRLAFVGMDKHFIASELSFYAPDRERITSRHLFGRHGFMFEQWEPASRYDGADLLALSLSPALLDEKKLAERANGVGALIELPIANHGRQVGVLYAREIRGYRALLDAPTDE